MTADADAAFGPYDPDADSRPDAGNLYRDNQQRLGKGLAVMGVVRDINMTFNEVSPDEDATNKVVKPRLREGPYPAEDVHARLHGFVEPPSYAECRKVLDNSGILLLRAGSGTGASTTAFALLEERYGTDGITGLDAPDDLSRWSPTGRRGYLLQGLSPAAAVSLGEVALNDLAGKLRRAGARLVITVRAEAVLSGETAPWQVVHHPPSSATVAKKRLDLMTTAGALTSEQRATVLRQLASADFVAHLNDHGMPQDGVDVVEALCDLVVSGRSAASVLGDLRTGSPAAAHEALAEACDRADRLALMATIALLPGLDRTVIEKFSAILRPLIDERGGPPASAATVPPQRTGTGETVTERSRTRRDVLGPAFEHRLEAVGARLLPLRHDAAQPYPVQPVVFSGRHRSDALLRCLWLSYEGMADLLWKTLDQAPHYSGVELAAGQAIGKTLIHATGPDTFRQLYPFAASVRRWHRRLVAYALGEMAEHPAFSGPVREQLRRWSRAASVPLRCTVAETCAGSFGLARPGVALQLLDTVLDRSAGELDPVLSSAVSFALSTLLSESTNRKPVLDQLREWQEAGAGTARHILAVHVIESMSLAAFPRPPVPSAGRTRLADLLPDHFGEVFALVVTALDDPATHESMAAGLSLIESDPELRQRAAFPHFLAALAARARAHRGVLRFVLRRHRTRTASTAEGLTA
ncbi:hypothetical protein [Streptomyces poonensis]|uniref:Uncharacterized protein n=1 Tax=Streptomyces poonensis TaxID=68255 RepID=A0A918PES5_9ACTN|nr:hypothetical protein [Streptomyces poonensis]GGZ04222.1 hypothetical protein GCM10010365_23940 [Streptomyces poonensis]GLJ89338.1 hypothetical protein GCM10017589_19380 [Streptomyces poonensis]